VLGDVDCCWNNGSKTKLLFGYLEYLAMDVGYLAMNVGIISEE